MEKPVISVVIPVYNEEEIIAGLLAQLADIPALEVIVSDGGSTDGTLAACRHFPCRLLSGPKGRGRQMNAGAAAARGDLLLFLHADSAVTPELFYQLGIKAGQKDAWGGCRLAFDDPAPLFRLIARGSNWRARHRGILFGDQGIFCRRDFFQAQGGFADLPLMEDLEFSRRLRRIERPVLLPAVITSSARRFRRGGPLQTILLMQLLQLLYSLGVPAATLAEIYRSGGGTKGRLPGKEQP